MRKLKIGITGQNGFVGSSLRRHIEIYKDHFELIPFERSFFESQLAMDSFVSSCDGIIHLAGLNRHEDPQVIFDTNIGLVENLIEAFERTSSKPHLLFSSSTQEENDSLYGKSKKISSNKFSEWAELHQATFTSFVIPNVFGPFSKPYYNTFIATFCDQLIKGQELQVNGDSLVDLIYVDDLVNEMLDAFKLPRSQGAQAKMIKIEPRVSISVESVFKKLQQFYKLYFQLGQIPKIESKFDLQLFNTFRSFLDPKAFFPRKYLQHIDNRGQFVELLRTQAGGQVSFSTTVPGVTRGNHFHTRKIERFAVIHGLARIELRRTDSNQVLSFELDGESPAFVDMPIWYTHNITNIGDSELVTVFWINEPYDEKDPDTYYVEV